MNDPSSGRVSVVIPTCRRHDSLPMAVRSALLQGPEVREVFVVDDNRAEEDGRRVRAALASIGDPRLQYLRNLGRAGGAASRNVAIRQATAPFVAFLDDDDQWLPGKIDSQLAAIGPEVVGIDCGYIERDDTWGLMLTVPGEARQRSQSDLLAGYCPTTSSLVMVRREVALRAGLMDERLSSFEDYDFWVRCAAFGSFSTLIGPHCVYVQHPGYRLSSAADVRTSGLDGFIGRWGDQLGGPLAVEASRRRWQWAAWVTNARRALPSDRWASLRFALKALGVDPRRQQGWQSLAFALAGFPLARRLSQRRNAGRSLSPDQRARLLAYVAALAEGDVVAAMEAWPA